MATEIKSTSIKSQNIIAEPQANKPGSPETGQIIQATGTGDIAKGIYHYSGAAWMSLDNAQGDLETLRLIMSTDTDAVGFSSALNSTSTLAGNTNAVPHETSTGTGMLGALEIPSTGGDALLTEFDANKVFRYYSAGANNNNDYFGIPIDIPAQTRGQNIVIKFKYRTEEASDTTSNGDFQVSVWDKSNGVSTTQASTLTTGTTISAGSNILMTAKTNLAVGDKIWFETGTNAVNNVANGFTQAYITSISSTDNNITVSEDIQVVASGIAVTGWLSDKTSGLLPSADSDTNKVGKDFSIAVKTEEDTDQIVLWISNKSTTTNVIELFFDGILVSQNKFLQASSQTKSEYYFAKGDSTFWNTTSSSSGWETDKLAVGYGSPPIADSRYLTFTEESTSLTRVYAKQDINLDVTFFATCTYGNQLLLYNSDDEPITQSATPDGATASSMVQVTAAIRLAKDDYIYATNNAGSNRYGGATFLATPQTSDVILLESQDEIFTDWNDYTMDSQRFGTGGTHGTLVYETARWRRVGSNMEIEYNFAQSTAGTAGTGNYYFSIPDGYAIDMSKINGNPIDSTGGTVVGEAYLSLASDYRSDYSDARGKVFVKDSTHLFLTHGQNSGTAAHMGMNIIKPGTLDYGSTRLAYSFQASVPISGWNANFNPLLSMPLVEIGANVEAYAVAGGQVMSDGDSTGTSAGYFVGSTTTPHVNTISNLGTVINGNTTGFKFTANQNVIVNANFSSASSTASSWSMIIAGDESSITNADPGGTGFDAYRKASSYTGNGTPEHVSSEFKLKAGEVVRFMSTNTGARYTANNIPCMSMTVEKDFSNTNMAHIIKPAVAYVKDLKAANTAGGTSTSGSFLDRELNTIQGESWFIDSLSSNVVTLQAGTYKIKGRAPFFDTGNTTTRLYDNTNSAVLAVGESTYVDTSNNHFNVSEVQGVFSFTAATAVKLQYRCASTVSSNGLGIAMNLGQQELYASLQIEKLK